MAGIDKLTATEIRNARPGKLGDGGGLWFVKRHDGGAQWVLRLTVHGRRRDMGLGRYPDVSLAEARREARRWRETVRAGLDPIKERERLAREAAKERPTLQQVFDECFEARKAQLKRDGMAGRWDSPLRVHVLPKLGKVPVEDIDQRDIRNVLAPIWHTKPEAAAKAAGRLHIVIQHGAAMGLDVDLQAVAKAKALLGKQRRERRNIPSLPWQEVPDFYRSLGAGVTELATRLLILTGCRSVEVRKCRVEEIDMSTGIWTVPAETMKGGKEHRVPLSEEALSVIRQAIPLARDGLLFPGLKPGRPLSDMTLTALMKRRGMAARPHGFRSSLRNWLAETTDAPHEVAEACLAHVESNKVVAAYRRTDFLEQRRALMARWADHVAGKSGQFLGVVQL